MSHHRRSPAAVPEQRLSPGPGRGLLKATSSAAAIIATVCLLVQDLAAPRGGKLGRRRRPRHTSERAQRDTLSGVGPIPNPCNIVRKPLPVNARAAASDVLAHASAVG
jgi:anthranilate/para-aminobenzoate synthase component II